ncbi:MAG: hypothetical protein OXF74_13565 [Rhodobacteraceae bacterium]|nr:hypothetical protein [Paracoccaceae bacterium]
MLSRLGLNETAVSRSKRQQLDHLLTVSAPHERVILIAAALLLMSLVLWTVFGRIAQGITIEGVLLAPGQRHDVVATEDGHLLEYFVVQGDLVKVGDPIARQSVPELEREAAALRGRIDLLARETDNPLSITMLESSRVALLAVESLRSRREIISAQSSGEVTGLQSLPGDYLTAGTTIARTRDSSGSGSGGLQAVLRVEPSIAKLIHPAMTATVELEIPNGSAQLLQGEVVSVTTPLPKWLAELRPATAEFHHRIDIKLHQLPEFFIPEGTACRVRITLGRKPLIALINPENL